MKKIIATVGPSLLNDVPLTDVHSEKMIYRINGAHGSISDIEQYIKKIKSQIENAQILMDLPGNKIRTTNFEKGFIKIEKGKLFSLSFDQMNYGDFYKHIKVHDVVWANDSTFNFTIEQVDINKKQIIFLSHSTGKLQSNKGLHVRGIHENIPFLFDKDKALINLANKYHLEFVGLSFVRTRHDIREAKELIDKDIEIISKVETAAAVSNLNDILKEVKYILIDRGDLSTEIGLHKVPGYQKYIIDKALFYGRKVFLATQFLKNMESNPIPTIPEVIDLYNTLKSGIYGIQMSEETAVGKFPINCIRVMNDLMVEINNERIA